MALGPQVWSDFRRQLAHLLAEKSDVQADLHKFLLPHKSARLHMPFEVAEFTDFYASKHHATNVGTMFRGAENALPPNWLHMPIGYNGRASSVVVSGTDVRRPWGQFKRPDDASPIFAPSQRFDLELELGAVVGQPSGSPVSVADAEAMIFGYVLLNDWSARDIQAWEYQPLGPFQGKATATTISPWIVPAAALMPFRCSTPQPDRELLPYLHEPAPTLIDVELAIKLAPSGTLGETIARTNYRDMYYSLAQQLAHHTTSGCPMRVGDLLGSGTISGADNNSLGCLLELSRGGKDPLELNGATRTFLHDGDIVTLTGAARGDGYTIGFGDCSGKILPALDNPYPT
jgi:fumarylacetoacetase